MQQNVTLVGYGQHDLICSLSRINIGYEAVKKHIHAKEKMFDF